MLHILAAVPGDVLEGSFMHVHPGVPGGARLSRHSTNVSSRKVGIALKSQEISSKLVNGIKGTKCFASLRHLFVGIRCSFGLCCLCAVYLSLITKHRDFSYNLINNFVNRIKAFFSFSLT